MEACQNHEMLSIIIIGLSSHEITLDEELESLPAETVQEKKKNLITRGR